MAGTERPLEMHMVWSALGTLTVVILETSALSRSLESSSFAETLPCMTQQLQSARDDKKETPQRISLLETTH